MISIFFILGLIVGSFLNVVVYRLSIAETILGRSMCPHCKVKIHWYDNIPLVSFILLRAKCRSCRENISWLYPIVEFFTGVVFAAVGAWFFDVNQTISWLETIMYLGVFSMLAVIFVYDIKFMEIPMIVFWLALGWIMVFFLILDQLDTSYIESATSLRIISGLIGGAVAGSFFFSLVYFSRERWMGSGDIYLGFLVGLLVGWPSVLLALVFSFSIGALVGIILMITRKKTMKSQIPFAPFLITGMTIMVFLNKVYPDIISRYFYF